MAYSANAVFANGPGPDATAGAREPRVHGCTAELFSTIERLNGILNELEKRLTHVLMPNGPSPVEKAVQQTPRPSRAPLVDTLDEATDKVRAIIGTAEELLRRLEV